MQWYGQPSICATVRRLKLALGARTRRRRVLNPAFALIKDYWSGTAAVFLGLAHPSHWRSIFSYVRFASGSGLSLARSAHSLACSRYSSAPLGTVTHQAFYRSQTMKHDLKPGPRDCARLQRDGNGRAGSASRQSGANRRQVATRQSCKRL